MSHTIVSGQIGQNEITLETGKIAKLADGAVMVREQNVCIGEVNHPKAELLQDLQRGAGLALARRRRARGRLLAGAAVRPPRAAG